MSTISHPRAINHVGVGVADLDAAIEWYTTIMGFSVVKQGFFVTSEQPGFECVTAKIRSATFSRSTPIITKCCMAEFESPLANFRELTRPSPRSRPGSWRKLLGFSPYAKVIATLRKQYWKSLENESKLHCRANVAGRLTYSLLSLSHQGDRCPGPKRVTNGIA
jgi:hypothetical protein